MLTNELLEAKYKAQQYLDKQAGHNLRAYVENVHEIVLAMEKKYDLKFRYGRIRERVEGDTKATGKNILPVKSHK